MYESRTFCLLDSSIPEYTRRYQKDCHGSQLSEAWYSRLTLLHSYLSDVEGQQLVNGAASTSGSTTAAPTANVAADGVLHRTHRNLHTSKELAQFRTMVYTILTLGRKCIGHSEI